jgi:hypothetical protein
MDRVLRRPEAIVQLEGMKVVAVQNGIIPVIPSAVIITAVKRTCLIPVIPEIIGDI